MSIRLDQEVKDMAVHHHTSSYNHPATSCNHPPTSNRLKEFRDKQAIPALKSCVLAGALSSFVPNSSERRLLMESVGETCEQQGQLEQARELYLAAPNPCAALRIMNRQFSDLIPFAVTGASARKASIMWGVVLHTLLCFSGVVVCCTNRWHCNSLWTLQMPLFAYPVLLSCLCSTLHMSSFVSSDMAHGSTTDTAGSTTTS